MPSNRFRRVNWPRVFGYDFFISFKLGSAPAGTQSYASDLARSLREAGFVVFYSEDELPPGETLTPSLKAALRRSSALVLVCNRAALLNPGWVRVEVEEYRRQRVGRAPIVINIDRALQTHSVENGSYEWLATPEHVWIDETLAASEAGLVSPAVLSRVQLPPRVQRANTLLHTAIGTVAVMLLMLSAVAVTKAYQANRNAEQAERARDRAVQERAKAEATLARSDFNRGISMVGDDDARRATPHLSRSMLLEPSAVASAYRLSSLLLQRPQPMERMTLETGPKSVRSLVYSPDGKHLAVLTQSDLRVYDSEGAEVLSAPCADQHIYSHLVISDDGRYLATSSTYNGPGSHGALMLWSLDDLKAPPQTWEIRGAVWRARFTASSDAIAVASAFAVQAFSVKGGAEPVWKVSIEELEPQVEGLMLVDNAFADFLLTPDALLLTHGIARGVIARWDWKARSFVNVQVLPLVPGEMSMDDAGERALLALPNANLDLFTLGRRVGGSTAFAIDTQTLKPVSVPVPGEDPFSAAVMLPHGLSFLTGAPDGELVSWAPDGSPLQRLRHREHVSSLAIAPHGWMFASGSKDGVARLWNALSSGLHSDDLVHDSPVTALAFSPVDDVLAVGTASGRITFWSIPWGPALPLMIQTAGTPSSLLLSPTGDRIVTVSDENRIELWDGTSGERIAEIAAPQRVALYPIANSRRVVAVSNETFLLLDLAVGQARTSWTKTQGGLITQVSGDAQGKRFLTAGESGVIEVWDAVSAVKVGSVQAEGPVDSAIFLRDGTIAWATGAKLGLGDATSGRLLRSAASATKENTPVLRDGAPAYETARIVDLVESSQAGRLIVTYGSQGNAVYSESIRDRYVAEQVALWTTQPFAQIHLLSVGHDALTRVRISEGGRYVALGSLDGRVRVWSTETGEPLGDELPHSAAITGIGLDPEGTHLVVADRGRRLSVWNELAGGRPITIATEGDISLTPSRGTLLVSQDDRNRIAVRDLATGSKVADDFVVPEPVVAIAASEGARRIAAITSEHHLLVWTVPFPDSLAERCALASWLEESAGFRLSPGDLPVPSRAGAAPSPLLAEKCSQEMSSTSAIGSWLTMPSPIRPLAPGFAGRISLPYETGNADGRKLMSSFLSSWPSYTCVRRTMVAELMAAERTRGLGELLGRRDGDPPSCSSVSRAGP